MKDKKKINKKNYILVFSVIVLSILLVMWKESTIPKKFVSGEVFVKTSDLFSDYEITKYPSNVEIIPPKYNEDKVTIGIVTDPWNLNFGVIPNGGSYGTRHVTISNFEDKKVKVALDVYGSIKQLVSFSGNNVVLKPKDSITFDVFLNTTEKTKSGNYTGEIDVTIQKPKYDFMYFFLQ